MWLALGYGDKFRSKSDKFRIKGDKFRSKSDKFRIKGDKKQLDNVTVAWVLITLNLLQTMSEICHL